MDRDHFGRWREGSPEGYATVMERMILEDAKDLVGLVALVQVGSGEDLSQIHWTAH